MTSLSEWREIRRALRLVQEETDHCRRPLILEDLVALPLACLLGLPAK